MRFSLPQHSNIAAGDLHLSFYPIISTDSNPAGFINIMPGRFMIDCSFFAALAGFCPEPDANFKKFSCDLSFRQQRPIEPCRYVFHIIVPVTYINSPDQATAGIRYSHFMMQTAAKIEPFTL